jgi:hypothetical protein
MSFYLRSSFNDKMIINNELQRIQMKLVSPHIRYHPRIILEELKKNDENP